MLRVAVFDIVAKARAVHTQKRNEMDSYEAVDVANATRAILDKQYQFAVPYKTGARTTNGTFFR
jgi:predicted P-loop ATPase